MTTFEEKLECISCHEKRTRVKAIKEGWRVVGYTHEIICEMCAVSIEHLTQEWFN